MDVGMHHAGHITNGNSSKEYETLDQLLDGGLITPSTEETAAEQRHVGEVKSYNSSKGYGFIACEVTYAMYGRDVFLGMQEFEFAGRPSVGTTVQFVVLLNSHGQPQATQVVLWDSSGTPLFSPNSPAAKPHSIRKQVEWYFSDANLSTDKFFYGKLTETMPEGWLCVSWLLRCQKLKDLGATESGILESLTESHLETKLGCVCQHCHNLPLRLLVRRKQPLPPFVGMEHKSADGTVVDLTSVNGALDMYKTMDRLRDQRQVQDTLGLKEIGDTTTVFREILSTYTGERILGPILAQGYERVVYGDHGPYLEFNEYQINWCAWPNFHDKSHFGELRFYDEYFTENSYRLWNQRWCEGKWPSNNKGLLMLYAQTQSVNGRPWAPKAVGGTARWNSGYADYREGYFYLAANSEIVAAGKNASTECNTQSIACDQSFTMANVCWQWQNGTCWRGRNCKWAHIDAETYKLESTK